MTRSGTYRTKCGVYLANHACTLFVVRFAALLAPYETQCSPLTLVLRGDGTRVALRAELTSKMTSHGWGEAFPAKRASDS